MLFDFHNYSLGLRSLNKFTLSSLASKKSENKIVSSWRLCLGLDLNTTGGKNAVETKEIKFSVYVVTNKSITISSMLAE